MKPKLYVVPTPIGNLKDITLRALEVLQASDLILCEDTRQSGKLLKHYEIQKTLQPLHKMNEHRVYEQIVSQILGGKIISLISDAGTPLISDPGNLLIAHCIQNQIDIETLPGATAFVPALVNSGFDLSSFVFLGFPPHKKGRQTFFKNLNAEPKTAVIYESPYRVLKFLEEFKTHCGTERKLSLSREISKLFEETARGNAEELIEKFTQKEPKGEFVIVVEPL